MCGITGYVGGGDSTEVIEQGLRNLEYRGYDSAGLALVGDALQVHKRQGTIDDVPIPRSNGATKGIGHTRWSTHGPPTDENAHPHTDCTGHLAVVHNGIISNYQSLLDDLTHHTFESETDTEVIPHLLEDHLAQGLDLLPAVQRVITRLEGSFAIAVTHTDYDGIIAARQDSPLVLGHDEDGTYVASDVTAFVEYTQRVTFLEDGDIAHVTDNRVEIYNDGHRVDRAIQEIDWGAEDTGKGGHEHYMHKEIHEQPHALRQTLAGRVDTTHGEVDLDIEVDDILESIEFVELVACGTSYHASMVAERLLETHTDLPVSVTLASEYDADGVRDPDKTLTIAVTQSGETADTLSAIRNAKAIGNATMAVTNTVGSTVTREVDDTIYIRAGPEIGVAATKTFVSQVATLALTALYVGRLRNTLTPSAAADALEDLQALPGAVQQILDQESNISWLAKQYDLGDAFFFIGRHLGYPVALESALKLKEISYEHAEGYAAGELKHGPLALVTPDTAVIAILTEGTRPKETLNNVKEVEARGAPVLGLSTIEDAESYCTDTITIPDIGDMSPVVANIALQLFAYHVAHDRDRDIDKPRNLAKSVTVE